MTKTTQHPNPRSSQATAELAVAEARTGRIPASLLITLASPDRRQADRRSTPRVDPDRRDAAAKRWLDACFGD